MAEESSGEKTEEPTPKRLSDARDEGNVPYSKDFTQTVLVVALFTYMLIRGEDLLRQLTEMILLPANLLRLSEVDFLLAANTAVSAIFEKAVWFLAPFIGIVLLLGVMADIVQVGFLMAFKKIKPKTDKLDAIKNLKNIFSKDNFVEFLKSFLKIGFLAALLFFLIRDAIPVFVLLPQAGYAGMGQVTGSLLKRLIIFVGLFYTCVSIFDLIWKRHSHRKRLMMTHQEVRRDYKESEGDPLIKGQRRAFHEELLNQDPVSSAKDASVVVTNPTHLAVALRYDETTPLPIVSGKGVGVIAEEMMAAAREAGVPVIQNIPLARALTYRSKVGRYIPSEFVEPVAEVLRLVREMKQREAEEGENFEDGDGGSF